MNAVLIISAAKEAINYLRDDANAHYVLDKSVVRVIFADSKFVDSVSRKHARGAVGSVYRSFNANGEYTGGIWWDGARLLFEVARGFVWNGADIVPDHLAKEPDKGFWAPFFKASLWHDWLWENAAALAKFYDCREADVMDFSNALFKSDVGILRGWTAHLIQFGYPAYKKIKNLF